MTTKPPTYPEGDPRHGLTKLSGREHHLGTLFEAWRTGILQARWVSEDGRIVVARRWSGSDAYTCRVDDVFLLSPRTGKPLQFRSFTNAARAGVHVLTARILHEQLEAHSIVANKSN